MRSAIAYLEAAADALENNERIHRAEEDVEQADHDAVISREMRDAIVILMAYMASL